MSAQATKPRLVRLLIVDETTHPHLVSRFGVVGFPTLVVVEGYEVRARLERPRGRRQIEEFLSPWLR